MEGEKKDEGEKEELEEEEEPDEDLNFHKSRLMIILKEKGKATTSLRAEEKQAEEKQADPKQQSSSNKQMGSIRTKRVPPDVYPKWMTRDLPEDELSASL